MTLRLPPAPTAGDWTLGLTLGAAVLVSGLTGVGPSGIDGRAVDAFAVLLALAVAGSLVLRRSYPLVTFAVASVATQVWFLSGYYGRVVLGAAMIMCYTVTVIRGLRWGAVAAAVTVLTGGLTVFTLFDRDSVLEPLIVGTSISVAAVALGLAVRYHRIYVITTQARLEQVELEREAEALRRVGDERLRIARELHDVVAHSIATINVQAATAVHVIDREGDRDKQLKEAREALAAIRHAGGEAMGELRTMLGVLRRVGTGVQPRHPAPSLGDLDSLLASGRAAGLQMELAVHGDVTDLPASVQMAAYRILQESLTNVVRHAGAQRVTVDLRYDRGWLDMEIADDGHGQPTPVQTPGYGLIGMRERVHALGGRFTAGPDTARGFRVSCRLPVGASR